MSCSAEGDFSATWLDYVLCPRAQGVISRRQYFSVGLVVRVSTVVFVLQYLSPV